MKELEPMIGSLTWREECIPVTATTWRIPAYGFLAGIELVMMEPLPNMDASAPWKLVASLEIEGQTITAGEPLPEIEPNSRPIVRAELRAANGISVRFGTCIAKFHRVTR